jgi:RHS repeat-associated protein
MNNTISRRVISAALVFAASLVLPHLGHCYYNASTGRWISRDAMEEHGGPNLYACAANDPASSTDYLGLSAIPDEWIICPCRCQSVEVTYDPGGDELGLGPYFTWYIGHTYGCKIHVKWNVVGNPRNCQFFQDEHGTAGTLVGLSPVRPAESITGVNGHSAPQEYTDRMGYDFGYFGWRRRGTWKMDVHWDVTFRCESEDGSSISRHDQSDVHATFKVPWW